MTAPTVSGVDVARRRLQDATRALRAAEQAHQATRAAQAVNGGAKPFQILGRCVGHGGEGGDRV